MSPFSPCRLLVIDDNRGDRRLVEVELHDTAPGRFTVIGADSLRAGVAALTDGPVDAALLDMGLPDSMGLETVQRFLAAAPHLPVVVLTGLDDRAMGVRAVAAGAQDYLVKGEARGDQLERAIAHAIQRKRIEGRLRDEESRLRGMLDSSPVGVAITRFDGLVVLTNPRLDALFAGAIAGRDAHEFYCDLDDRAALMAELTVGRRVEEREVRFRRVDGSLFWGLLTMAPTEWDGSPALLTWIYDISRRKDGEEALRRSRDAAQEAARAKAAFLATLSHEIRTPLNGMMGMLQVLLDMPLGEVQRERAETVVHSAEALMSIVDGVLDLAKLEAGRMTLAVAPFDLARLMEGVVNLMASRAAEKGLALARHHDPALPSRCLGDAGRLRQVLLNLISNAVKFTEQGGVTVAVAVANAPEQPGGSWRIGFEVADTGPGLSAAVASHLFEAFNQGEPEISSRYGGTGLGLSICRELVALMGGEIGVETRPGRGTAVRVTVPLAAAPDQPAGTETAPGPGGRRLRPLRVLVAEDNPINQRVLAAMLERDGHLPVLVTDGQAAVDAVRATLDDDPRPPFDLVLMDVRMPRLDGHTATAQIRALGGAATHLPVYAVTADALGQDVRAALAAGMDGHLAKPIRLGALRDVLAKAAAGGRHPAVGGAGPGAPEGSSAAVDRAEAMPAFDRAVLDALGQELNRAFLADLAAAFVQRAAEDLAVILHHTDSPRRRQAAHDLKATAGNFGLTALSERARRVEVALAEGRAAEAATAAAGLAADLETATAALRRYFPELAAMG